MSWKTLAPNIWNDQKQIYWHYPNSLAHGQHWKPTVAVLAVTGALIGVDQYISPHFRRTTAFEGFNTAFSGTATGVAIAAVPSTIYVAGLFKSDSYAQSTGLLSAEAIVDSELAAEILKLATRRARPESICPTCNFADTWLDAPTVRAGGFPSGHTTAAFSVATVLSRRYGHDHRWVPFVAYGLASTIGFSRVTLSAHNVSDVFVGAALGYAITRFVVLGHHRP